MYYCILCTQWACKGSEGSTWGDNCEPEAASTSLNPEKMFLTFRYSPEEYNMSLPARWTAIA